MQTKILVPVDGSPLAESALGDVSLLARTMGSDVVLLQVVPDLVGIEPVIWPVPMQDPMVDYQGDLDAAENYLAAQAARLRDEGLTVQTQVLVGDAARGIVAYARQNPTVAMIAMSTHGRSGLLRWIFGSVTGEVLHLSPVPVLLVRPLSLGAPAAPRARYGAVLVPLDGSPFAEQALGRAVSIAKAMQATLVLVSAVDSPTIVSAEVGDAPIWLVRERESEAARLEAYLQATAARLRAEGLDVETHLVHGRPMDGILATVAEADASLIVMATHGREGFQRLRLGSVALEVVQRTALPVLLVRPATQSGLPEYQPGTDWRASTEQMAPAATANGVGTG